MSSEGEFFELFRNSDEGKFMMIKKCFFWGVLFFVALSKPLQGQGDRWLEAARVDLLSTKGIGFLMPTSNGNKGQIKYYFDFKNPSYGIVEGSLDLGMEIYDSAWVTSKIDSDGSPGLGDGKVLFCGRDSAGKGVLALVGPTVGKFQLLARKVFPNRSFLGVSNSLQTKKLYLLDGVKKEILKGGFDPLTSTLPSSLTVVANSTQVAGLKGDLTPKTLYAGSFDQGVPGMVLGDYPHPMEGQRFWLIWDKPTGPVATEHLGERGFPVLAEPTGLLLDGQTHVKVEGLAGEGFQVRSGITGQIMGGGVLPSTGVVEVTVQPLVMGDIYGVWSLRDSRFHGSFSAPIKQWGTESTLPSGFHFVPFHPQRGLVAEIEQGGGAPVDISPTLRLSPPKPAPKNNKQWNAWLLIGTDQDVTQVGNEYVITSGVSIAQTIDWVAGSEDYATASAFFSAPNDPDLAGTVATFQWMVEEGGTLYFSPIIGVMLRLEPWEPDQAFGEGPSSAANKSSGSSRQGTKKRLPQKGKKLNQVLRGKLLRWWIKGGAKPIPESRRKAMLRKG